MTFSTRRLSKIEEECKHYMCEIQRMHHQLQEQRQNKVRIGFALSTLRDWLKKFAPFFHPVRSKTKPMVTHLHAFSRALRQVHVITSSFDWFTGLSVSFLIG